MPVKKPTKSTDLPAAPQAATKQRSVKGDGKAKSAAIEPIAATEAANSAAQPVIEVRHTPVPPKSVKSAKASAESMTTSISTDTSPSYQQISDAAYFLWQNGTPGSAFDHWVSAEASLRGRI